MVRVLGVVIVAVVAAIFHVVYKQAENYDGPRNAVPTLLPWPVHVIGMSLLSTLYNALYQLGPPHLAVLWHAGGFASTAAIHAAAKLDIADHLHPEPMAVEHLAKLVGPECVSRNLERLLRALESIGFFHECKDGRWSQTPQSDLLRKDHPSSMKSLALMVGGPQYLSIVRVDETIRSGRPAFETVYGSSFWVHLDENPGYNTSQVRETVLTMPGAEEQHTFQQALSSVSELMDPAIVADYPFGKFSSLIDIGGGQGAFVRRLQLQHPTLRTAIFDQAAVIEQTRAANQCNGSRLIAGDFHQSVPSGFDAYFLKQIMHDWSDTHCEVILKTIARAMTKSWSSTLLIAERIIVRKAGFVESHGTAFHDLLMMSNFGDARERTEDEFRIILGRAGLQLRRVVPTRSAFVVIEATLVD